MVYEYYPKNGYRLNTALSVSHLYHLTKRAINNGTLEGDILDADTLRFYYQGKCFEIHKFYDEEKEKEFIGLENATDPDNKKSLDYKEAHEIYRSLYFTV